MLGWVGCIFRPQVQVVTTPGIGSLELCFHDLCYFLIPCLFIIYNFISFLIHSFLPAFFFWRSHSCCSCAWVLGTTLDHECHIFFSHSAHSNFNLLSSFPPCDPGEKIWLINFSITVSPSQCSPITVQPHHSVRAIFSVRLSPLNVISISIWWSSFWYYVYGSSFSLRCLTCSMLPEKNIFFLLKSIPAVFMLECWGQHSSMSSTFSLVILNILTGTCSLRSALWYFCRLVFFLILYSLHWSSMCLSHRCSSCSILCSILFSCLNGLVVWVFIHLNNYNCCNYTYICCCIVSNSVILISDCNVINK